MTDIETSATGRNLSTSLRRRPGPVMVACSALALLLSACETSGHSRYASVGTPPPSPGGGGGSEDGSGGNPGGGNPGGGNGGGSGGGSSGLVAAAVEQVTPVMVTAGNAVLGVSNGLEGVTTPIATALPVTQPVTGTITRVLQDTGTVLVDAGEGRTLLLQGAQGVVGDIVTIDLGSQSVITGLDGTPGAIGVGALGDAQPLGTVASLGVLNAGNTALASVNGVADVRITNVTAPTGGVADNLLNVALGGNQLLGTAGPALINANVLPNGVPLPGTGSGGVTSGLLGSVGSTISSTVGSVGSSLGVGGTASADVGNGGASAGAGATTGNNGLLAPLANTVSGALGSLGSLGTSAGPSQ